MEAWETCYCLHFFVSKMINPINEELVSKTEPTPTRPLFTSKSSIDFGAQVHINICNKKYNKIILSMFDGAHDWFYTLVSNLFHYKDELF